MTQIWAVVSSNGDVFYRYTTSVAESPRDSGFAKEFKGRNLWPLDREPLDCEGETVDYETGEIIVNAEFIRAKQEAAIRAEATAAILAIWPQPYHQINDAMWPGREGAAERIAAVKAIQDECNAKIKTLQNHKDKT